MRILFLFLSATVLLQADPDFSTLKNRLTALETKTKLAEHYNPRATTASGLILNGDALYWQAQENGIPYALLIKNPLAVFINPDEHFRSKVKQMQFDWDFGARASIGWQFARDAWGVLATWTHFNTKASDKGFNTSSKRFDPIWADPRFVTLVDSAVQAESIWKLFHNTLDLTLGRPFYVSRYLILQPEFGVSAALIKQHFHLTYLRALLPGVSDPVLHNNFRGIGLLAGLDTRFCLGGGWSLFNLTHFELYGGQFHLQRKETFTTELAPLTQQRTTAKNHVRKICPALQMQLGLRWQKDLFQGKQSVAIKLACDYQIFWFQNQFLRLIENPPIHFVTNQGDLSFVGGTFSVLFVF